MKYLLKLFLRKEIGLNKNECRIEVKIIPANKKIDQPFPPSHSRHSATVYLFAQYMICLAAEERTHIRSNGVNDI